MEVRTADESPAALVARARQGDEGASTLLVRRYLRAAYAVALAIVRRPHEAEDLAQDAFVVAFEKLDQCRDPDRFSAWLLQIVRNRARNHLDWRRLREAEPVPAEPALDSADPDAFGLRDQLLAALGKLSPVQREVVLLHDLEGWSHGEIAATLELSEVNSRQHLFQARRALRGLLAEAIPAEADHE